MTEASAWRLTPAALLAAFVCYAQIEQREARFHVTLGVLMTASAIWLLALRAVLAARYRPSLREAFAWALACRVVLLWLEPALSDDVHRYAFEGRLVLEGLSPYAHAPIDASVAHLRDAHWHLINNKAIAAAYPPAMQFANAAGVALADLFGMRSSIGVKSVYVVFDLAAFVVLWRWLEARGLPGARAIGYGFCPLPIVEFAAEGHGDSLAIFGILAACLWAQRARPLLAGTALGLATAGKLLPIVLLPFVARGFGRSGWSVVASCLATIGLAWAWFLWIDPHTLFDGTVQYVVRWRSNDSGFALLYMLCDASQAVFGPFEVQRFVKLPLAFAGLAVLAVAYGRRARIETAATAFFVFFLSFAPTVHPWYVAFLVPFLAFYPNPGWLAFAASVFLAYHVVPGWVEARVWRESSWIKLIEYAPLYFGTWWAWRSRDRNSRSV